MLYFPQISMENLYEAHEGDLTSEHCLISEHMNGVAVDNENVAMVRTFSGDRRLVMFGYTIETLNMLLLPMVTTQSVKHLLCYCTLYLNAYIHL